ncbi:1-phosphofructokinase family hexose kinase [Plantactinospora sp. GCM10030261]|uniref:1-phosphofructokinase family hexose kinase n=1 Tax=Plantactinospora sp. GCM10030261 TaxID=3273420 RepID=UPI00362007D4
MDEHAMVFAPTPQLTITVDQPADDVEIHLHPGGQGVWQARMIMRLGVPVVLCATAGGEIGQVLEPLLASEGVDLAMIRRDTASGGYVHDRRDGKRLEIADVPGAPLGRHDLDELYNLALAKGLRAPVSVLSGTGKAPLVPADMYRRLAADLGGNGSQVVADLSGPFLSAVLDSGELTFLKVSHEELQGDGLIHDDSAEELTRAMREMAGRGARTVVVSRAGEPALALIEDEVLEVRMPKLEAADPRGAGDSMTAGVAAVLAKGGDIRTAVRTGAAAGALNVTRHGLGTGRTDALEGLLDRVELVPLTERDQGRRTADELAERHR